MSQAKIRKLLVVTPYFSAHGGGIESVAWQLIRHLKAQNAGLQIEWMASDCDAPPRASLGLKLIGARCWNGLEKRSGLPVPLWSLGALSRLWRAIRRSDVVHFHDVVYECSLLTALFCRWQGKPYVVTQHTGFVAHPQAWMRALRSLINRGPGCWMLRGAAATVFISDAVRREFAPLLPGQTLSFIYNGVDPAVFCAPEPEKRRQIRLETCRELGLDPNRPLLLFVGRFVARKGVDLLVELSARVGEANWVFAGQGPLDMTQKIGANGRIAKHRQGEALARLYQSADLLILPAYGEGFPLVVQEALACGAPVLVETAIGEAAPHAKTWMSFETLGGADETARWESAVRKFLAIWPEAESLRQKRADFAAAQWNWDTCAQSYGALFEAAVKSQMPKNSSHGE